MYSKFFQKSLYLFLFGILFLNCPSLHAGEESLILPQLSDSQINLLLFGILICLAGVGFAVYEFFHLKSLKAHQSMLDVAEMIFETAKTYLKKQGVFLIFLEVLIGFCIAFYFIFLRVMPLPAVLTILGWSIAGILGSYSVAWYGIRVNTLANSRMAFSSLENKPLKLLNIPLQAGMSIGVLLICIELVMMLIILLTVPGNYAGYCFLGFAIGESLGASVLRIAGGIFTKIADIGSDLMKIEFKLKEDDPNNPGVIADCTGDNAGDSVGPTADGFETYGVTGVALISFIILAVFPNYQSELITWIFIMRITMILTSLMAYYINKYISNAKYSKSLDLDFEKPLTHLVWISSIISIIATFGVSYWFLNTYSVNSSNSDLWLLLSIIISFGTLGAAIIPEVTKVFTSTNAKHTKEVVNASSEGGASLNILSGLVSGNFSAFWKGLIFLLLMFFAYFTSTKGLSAYMSYEAIFAFGLVAFGFLSMGPVTIAVDSYGPVTDNAQSIYELSLIESIPDITNQIKEEFGFTPEFQNAKHYLEANDGAGNTFKATSKPVLIGTAVVGATTMIFSLILVLKEAFGSDPIMYLNMINPYTLLGLLAGGAVIYWFSGASIQAVTAGAYRAVQFIKKNINLSNESKSAATENSKEVVRICTQYAQKGMINIFIGIFSFAMAFALLSASSADNPQPASFFISYLISIAIFGLYQAIFMANAGGCWDNAKKIVEVDLKQKNTPLHEAAVVGDTVGDPFKDTSSVSLNPIIKFTTLFGMLAMEIAINPSFVNIAPIIGGIFLIIALVAVYRSFYYMRIK